LGALLLLGRQFIESLIVYFLIEISMLVTEILGPCVYLLFMLAVMTKYIAIGFVLDQDNLVFYFYLSLEPLLGPISHCPYF
jgi:hypothetical protein